jgi:glycosyltransferase involved in cell wall biosynthesis
LTYAGLTVVVPTRNRSELAATAIRSVVEQGLPDVSVLVSDNSTTASDAAALEAVCEELDGDAVRYVRPGASLPMSPHWQWALQQALERSSANHILYLTDRMLFKPGALADLARLVEARPESVLSYHHDTVFDHERPVRLLQEPWSGRLFEIASNHLLYLSSRAVIHAALPRMLNCVVPRDVLSLVQARFGTAFDSISPDFCFAYRCLGSVERIHYLDEALMIQHGLGSSHGFTYTRGVDSSVRSDFSEQLGPTKMNFAAPVPEFQTIRNAILHEYAFVRSEAGSDRFPEIDPRGYLAAIVEDLSQIEDRRVRRNMLTVLADNGWVGAPKRRYQRAMLGLRLMFAGWDVLRAVSRMLRRLPGRLGRQFETPEAAIDHAQRRPRVRETTLDHVSALFTPPGSTTEIERVPA